MTDARGPAAATMASVTPLVLTFNEAPNIGRCLERLAWAARVVVLDSGSTDETASIVARFPNADLHTRAFDDHTRQWNHGLGLITTPWVLSLDADYVLPEGFGAAIDAVLAEENVDAAEARFRYCVFGRPLHASLYPPRAVLFRRDRCRYEADGHTQRLKVPGRTVRLAATIDHDDRKPLDRWFSSQQAYARLEAEKLLASGGAPMGFQDRLRRGGVLAPLAVLFYTLIIKRTLFDGWPGWYYALQRTTAEVLLALRVIDRRLRR
jgi:glycosyltransferase involved in cell wall biosynthesis